MTNTFNMNNVLEEAEKEWGASGGKNEWFKIVEGANIIRILTPLVAYASHFKAGACLGKELCPICIANSKEPDESKHNKVSVKFLCHVLNGNDIKIAQLPYSIAKAIQTLQNDPDYAFNEVPMPYNIKIMADKAGTKEVSYTTIASPKREPVAKEILEKLAKLHTPEQIRDSMKNKRAKELGITANTPNTEKMKPAFDEKNYPKDDISPEDIPF